MSKHSIIGTHVYNIETHQTGTLVSFTVWAIGTAEAKYIDDKTQRLVSCDLYSLLIAKDSWNENEDDTAEDDYYISNVGRVTADPPAGRIIAYRVEGFRIITKTFIIRFDTPKKSWLEFRDVNQVVLDTES